MNFKKGKLFFILFFITVYVFGQENWTLDNCISYALEHNLTLMDYQYLENSGKESYNQSIRDLLPRVNGFADYNIRYGRSTDPNTNDIINTDFFSNGYSLSASIDLFQGFQKINTIKARKLLFKATKETAQQQRFLLALRVMTAYHDIQFYEGLLAISEEQLTISEANFKLAKKQIELGLKAGADLYEAESILYTDQLDVTQSENQLQAAKLILIQEMNLENAHTIQLSPIIPLALAEIELETDSIYLLAKDFVPLLKAQRYRTEAAKKELGITRGRLYPSLSFATGYGTGYYETTRDTLGVTIPFKNQIKDNASRFVGFSLSVPIFNAWSTRSAIKQQKIAISREQNNMEIQEQEIYKAIQQLIQENKALNVELVQSEKQIMAQELAFGVAQKKYEKGLFTIMELNLAKSMYATSQNKNLQVKLLHQINQNTLSFYQGSPIFNINSNN
ncbi:TolC family protein [Arenibacter sp. TNZ]|jgi:outer membrane protein TolC|uniref:TolC family protein n=1 Tax=Arenibacter TaxID=178469 RepID=UPI000CD413AB|nr:MULTISPECIES: TolC family protein [Arenibacter]MCM4172281.1 TolC family protein [Arenibacter sp. TNZ]